LHYAFPTGFPEDILEEMASNPKICNYIDIPLQHINDAMLKSMRRGTTRAKTDRLLNKMREVNPDMAIRTTLISGYPGETLDHHNEMVNWVREMKFDRLGVFAYSHEENTHAFALEDDVPAEEKQRRVEEIMAVQEEISLANNEQKVGKTLRVLIDRKESGYFIGRTQYDSPEVDNEVSIPAENTYLRIGDFADVKIVDCSPYDLVAKVVSSEEAK
jgi:ribosomal protein S12 methylthiotransferase